MKGFKISEKCGLSRGLGWRFPVLPRQGVRFRQGRTGVAHQHLGHRQAIGADIVLESVARSRHMQLFRTMLRLTHSTGGRAHHDQNAPS